MISDVLSDSVALIQDYLEKDPAYEQWKTDSSDSDLCKQRVYEALEAMEMARICLDSQGCINHD